MPCVPTLYLIYLNHIYIPRLYKQMQKTKTMKAITVQRYVII